jgi:hypothetical protein
MTCTAATADQNEDDNGADRTKVTTATISEPPTISLS